MKSKYKKFLKAAYIDYSEDYCSSGPSTFTKPTVTTPIIVITGNIAIIACAVSGVTIYYTLDGSTPTSSSTLYTGTITLTHSCTIKAIAVKPGMTDSEVASESYVHYLTQWKIVGNSEVHGNEIWSCGEYNPIDGKWHILVKPLGGNVADIALDAPLRKVNDVADTIEFPSDTEGKALVTRNLGSILMGGRYFSVRDTKYADYKRFMFFTGVKPVSGNDVVANGLCSGYNMITNNQTYNINADGTGTAGIGVDTGGNCYVFDPNYNTASDANAIKAANANTEFIYELATPTTELVDAPQIEEADSYSMVISQSAKAVEWSDFETE